MKTNLIITDDFYGDPDNIRNWVLKQPFDVKGNYPGRRTAPVHDWDCREVVQRIIQSAAGKITYWNGEYTSAFQYTTADDNSWIHSDNGTTWAGVCYLTPNAPAGSGTGLFRHKETGYERSKKLPDGSYDLAARAITDKDNKDYSKWDMTAMVGNVYNRLVLYRGDMFHRSLDYFGKDRYDGRLFQTFFFDTERR